MSSSAGVFPPIPPNPGGALEPNQVIGRERVIAECWRSLETRSVALLAPRRIGKTSMLTRMMADPPPGFEVVRRDLEGLQSAAEFVHVLFEDVERLLGRWKCKAKHSLAYLGKLAVDTPLIKVQLQGPQWKRLLDRLFDDLEDQLARRDQLLVLLWDEVTLFISDLVRHRQADDAIALLDSLRAVRQRHTHIRMVLTGSIGFAEILRQLQRDHGYRNRPLNDVAIQFVPLLDEAGSERLVRGLLRHGRKQEEPTLIQTMIARCEGHPFVIQLLADRLLQLPQPRAEDVGPHLIALLSPPGDPLDFNYYLERIDKQFDVEQAAVARAVLDALARTEAGINRAALIDGFAEFEREAVLAVVRRLEDDFYLRREQQNTRFMLELLRRFWAEERGL
jgi:hypothetical protein